MIIWSNLDVLGKNIVSAIMGSGEFSKFFMFLMILVESPINLGKMKFNYGIIDVDQNYGFIRTP